MREKSFESNKPYGKLQYWMCLFCFTSLVASFRNEAFSQTIFNELMAYPVEQNIPLNQKIKLSLEECLLLAKARNSNLKSAKMNIESAYWDAELVKANLRPRLTISGDIPGYNRFINSVTQPDGTVKFVGVSQALTAVSATINQQIASTGTSFSISTSLNRFEAFAGSRTSYWQSAPFVLSLSQPLFRFNEILWQKRRAPIRLSISQKRYAELTADLNSQITEQFFSLYLAQISLRNANANNNTNDTIFKQAQGRFSVGKIAENDLLQAELALMRTRAEKNQLELELQRSARQLCVVLNITLQPDGMIEVMDPPKLEYPPVDSAQIMREARENRSDWQNFELRTLDASLDLKRTRLSYKLNGSLNINFGYNQTSENFKNAYSDLLERQSASIGFSMPILNFGRAKADINSSEAALKGIEYSILQEKRQFEQDIWLAIYQLELSKTQLQIAEKADHIAQKRYEVATNRYLVGNIEITNLQIAQNEKDNARRTLISATRDFWLSYYKLQRLSLFNWKEQRKIFSEP